MTTSRIGPLIDYLVNAFTAATTLGAATPPVLIFDGPVVTDDLGAVAITSRYKQADAVARAIEAGNDLLVFANQATYVPDLAARLVDIIEALVSSGRISEARIDASIARLDRLTAPPPIS